MPRFDFITATAHTDRLWVERELAQIAEKIATVKTLIEEVARITSVSFGAAESAERT